MITGKTGSGMLYGIRRSHSTVGYCALSINCGTRDESTHNSGIAHFVEHTIFKGTDRKSSTTISSYLDKLGGELNAFTTKEEIVLHATVLKEDLNKAASLLFELATSATFPTEEINVEKGVVTDEINSYKDMPSEDIYDTFEEMLFHGHPLSGQILGTAKSVRKITSAELRRFVKENFTPDRMAFTVVADIEEKKLEKAILRIADKYIPASAKDTQRWERKRIRPERNVFDVTLARKNHQANCIIGSLAPSLYMEKERFAAILLCNILGGPASNSILNSILREKNGWVYDVECSYTQYSDSGIVAICLGCDKENLEKCTRVIHKEIARLQETPLSERRLKAAKKQLLGQLAISSDNGETQCLSMGKSLMAYGMIADSASTIQHIEAVTSEEIMEAAQKIFDKEHCSKLIFD